MVMLEVYSKNIKVKYKAFLLSKASFVAISCGLISIVFPFVLCYETGGFWQKRDIIYKQPNVKFVGNFLFLATTNDHQKPVSCSSFPSHNKDLKALDNCSIIKVRESDENHDGKVDFLQIMISAKLQGDLKVTSLNLVLPLNYSLSSPCAFHTQSVIIYQQTILDSASAVSVYADLGLKQSEALKCSKYGVATNNNPVIEGKNFQMHTLDYIIEKYYTKSKIKTTLDNVLTTFNPINHDSFTLSLTVKYPEHKIYYKPRLWQIIKFAWIQYLAMYIIVSWIIIRIKQYIFKNNLVLLYEDRCKIKK